MKFDLDGLVIDFDFLFDPAWKRAKEDTLDEHSSPELHVFVANDVIEKERERIESINRLRVKVQEKARQLREAEINLKSDLCE